MAGYKELSQKELKERIESLEGILESCELCPRRCGVNRLKGEIGYCKSGILPKIASWNLHFGEEPPISGMKGSGTIFFSNCTMKCVFCQNYPISQLGVGKEVSIETLANYMLELQKKGAHNINFVTPTHFVPQMIKAIYLSSQKGLSIPIVYNTSGYERVEILKLLEGIIDIYLPDAKYSSNKYALKYSDCMNYVEYNRKALIEMYSQVGLLKLDKNGIAQKGLIIRHLVLPKNIAETEKTLAFIKENLSNEVHISLMSQYFPANKAHKFPEISQKITRDEFIKACEIFDKLGFENGWIQPYINEKPDIFHV